MGNISSTESKQVKPIQKNIKTIQMGNKSSTESKQVKLNKLLNKIYQCGEIEKKMIFIY